MTSSYNIFFRSFVPFAVCICIDIEPRAARCTHTHASNVKSECKHLIGTANVALRTRKPAKNERHAPHVGISMTQRVYVSRCAFHATRRIATMPLANERAHIELCACESLPIRNLFFRLSITLYSIVGVSCCD